MTQIEDMFQKSWTELDLQKVCTPGTLQTEAQNFAELVKSNNQSRERLVTDYEAEQKRLAQEHQVELERLSKQIQDEKEACVSLTKIEERLIPLLKEYASEKKMHHEMLELLATVKKDGTCSATVSSHLQRLSDETGKRLMGMYDKLMEYHYVLQHSFVDLREMWSTLRVLRELESVYHSTLKCVPIRPTELEGSSMCDLSGAFPEVNVPPPKNVYERREWLDTLFPAKITA